MMSTVSCISLRRVWYFCNLHVLIGSFLLQEFLSLHEPPGICFKEQNMKFTVNMLLASILYCDAGPGCD